MEATEYFMSGYSCSESIVKWGIEQELLPEGALSLATSFSGGMGSKCLCGAIAGSQMIIGSLYGKENRFGNDVVAIAKARELVQQFVAQHGATCCKVLTRGMDMASPERKAHCVNMVESCANILKSLIDEKAIK